MTLKEKLGLAVDPVFLMDGTAFIYRAFYANRHMRRSDGFPTNSLVIVSRVLLRILRQEKPRHFMFAMDGKDGNFRYDLYNEYKANRETMPEDLVCQIEPVKRMAKALGLHLEIAANCEADDCIASLAARFSRELPVIIVSGDKDLKQCLGPNVFMWDPGSKEEKILTVEEFRAENGVNPAQWPDVQALVGDSSDNIPGVKGIGPKMAKQIFEICANLEEIAEHLALLPPKEREKLETGDNLKKMFLWRELATLRLDECPSLTLDDLRVRPINLEECEKIADEFELSAVRREIASLCAAARNNDQKEESEPEKMLEDAPEETIWPPAQEKGDLPDCSNKAVAVIWLNAKDSPRVAVGEMSAESECDPATSAEFIFTGTIRALREWLGEASVVVVEDLKNMLARFYENSEKLPPLPGGKHGPRFVDLGLASYLLAPEDGDYSWRRIAGRWRDQLGCRELGPAALALAMAGALRKNMDADGLAPLYENIELPLAPVLARMEETGIAIDPAAFQKFLEDVSAEMDKIVEEIYERVGARFNIRSAKQLGDLLYGHMGLQPAQKTPGGQPSTSQAALEKLAGANPVVDSILQFRKLDKMRSTYLDPLPKLMDAHCRLHTTFNQKATATGRISSTNPNLQNIPVRGPMGQRMRSCFVADKGKMLVAADYSQIELRVLAHMSQDRHLMEAFHNGQDIHARTASIVFDVHREEVTADQRRMAKTINFGLLYGMGARKLAQELKISQQDAKDFIARYFERLSGLKTFYEKILEDARKNGYVTTMAGRRRWLPGLRSDNHQAEAQAKRQAVNAVIQGTAADIIKLAMIAVAHDGELAKMDAAMLLQVHDELLLEAPEANAREVGQRVASLMENISPGGNRLDVPLAVDWGVGRDWGEAH